MYVGMCRYVCVFVNVCAFLNACAFEQMDGHADRQMDDQIGGWKPCLDG